MKRSTRGGRCFPAQRQWTLAYFSLIRHFRCVEKLYGAVNNLALEIAPKVKNLLLQPLQQEWRIPKRALAGVN